MNGKIREISAVQLVLLLVVTRLFTLLTFTPRPGNGSGATALLVIPISALGMLLAGIPAVLLHRKDKSLLDAAKDAGKLPEQIVAAAFGLFCLLAAAYTIGHFSYFLISTVYANAQPGVFAVCLTLAAAYAARLGLEPLARASLPIFLLVAGGVALMAVGLAQYIRMERVFSPLYDGWGVLWQGIGSTLASYTEGVLFLLFAGRTKQGKTGHVWAGWVLLAAVTFELLAFLTLTALGDYAGTRQFPLHAAAAAARLEPFGRLDLLFLFIWIGVAFVRTAVFIYGAAVCLGRFASGRSLPFRAWTIGGAALLLCVLAHFWQPVWYGVRVALSNGIWIGILLFILPLLLLLAGKRKPQTKEAKK